MCQLITFYDCEIPMVFHMTLAHWYTVLESFKVLLLLEGMEFFFRIHIAKLRYLTRLQKGSQASVVSMESSGS